MQVDAEAEKISLTIQSLRPGCLENLAGFYHSVRAGWIGVLFPTLSRSIEPLETVSGAIGSAVSASAGVALSGWLGSAF